MPTEFRFNIGDLIVTRQGMEEAKLSFKSGRPCSPRIFSIVGRVSEEMEAGVMRFYFVHSFEADKIGCGRVVERDAAALSEWIPPEGR